MSRENMGRERCLPRPEDPQALVEGASEKDVGQPPQCHRPQSRPSVSPGTMSTFTATTEAPQLGLRVPAVPRRAGLSGLGDS